jgi:hypothetical protein
MVPAPPYLYSFPGWGADPDDNSGSYQLVTSTLRLRALSESALPPCPSAFHLPHSSASKALYERHSLQFANLIRTDSGSATATYPRCAKCGFYGAQGHDLFSLPQPSSSERRSGHTESIDRCQFVVLAGDVF